MIQELVDKLTADIKKGYVTTSILCGQMLFLTEDSRKTPPYLDPKYIPFYYHLGKYIHPKRMVEVGVRLGLFSASFLKSCKTVEYLAAFQEKTSEFYSPRLALRNIRLNYSGKIEIKLENKLPSIFGEVGPWDLVILNEELDYDTHRIYLDTLWNGMAYGGYIVHDYVNSHKPAGQALEDFATTKKRRVFYVPTRYGVGIVQK